MRTLTYSSLTCAKTCLKKYNYRYNLGIVRDREDSPLYIGSFVHKGLEIKAVPDKPDYPSWCTDPIDQHKHDCDYALAAACLRAYFAYWKDDACETIESEVTFHTPIVNPETGKPTPIAEAAGKVDKIIKLPDGRRAIMEHKTTTDDIEPDSMYWRRLAMDQQISHYCLALGCDCVVYDVIKKPSIRPKETPVLDENNLKVVLQNGERAYNKNGSPRQSAGEGQNLQTRPETPEEFGARAEPLVQFCRREIPRFANDIDEYKMELWQMHQQLNECAKHNRWYRNTAACIFYSRPCEYFDLCTTGSEQGYTKCEIFKELR